MTRNEIIIELKDRLEEYLNDVSSPSKGKDQYVCPVCGSGTKQKKTGALTLYRNGRYPTCTCHACKSYNDTSNMTIFDLCMKINGFTTFQESYEYLCQRYGYHEDRPAYNPGENYLIKERGLTTETIKKYRLRYLKEKDIQKKDGRRSKLYNLIQIPYPGTDFSSYKFIKKNGEFSGSGYYKDFGKEPLFNGEIINKEKVVFITEAQLCAISIDQASDGEYKAVATGGTGFEKLLHFLDIQDTKSDTCFIVCYDNDRPGKEAGKSLTEKLNDRGYLAIQYNIARDKKDPNEALVSDPIGLGSRIHKAVEKLRSVYQINRQHQKMDKIGFLPFISSKHTEKYTTGLPRFDQLCPITDGVNVIQSDNSFMLRHISIQMASAISKAGNIEIVLLASWEEILHYQNAIYQSVEDDAESIRYLYIDAFKEDYFNEVLNQLRSFKNILLVIDMIGLEEVEGIQSAVLRFIEEAEERRSLPCMVITQDEEFKAENVVSLRKGEQDNRDVNIQPVTAYVRPAVRTPLGAEIPMYYDADVRMFAEEE